MEEQSRCAHCNKKMKLMKWSCRCDKLYCDKCRMPEDHNCLFDYQEHHKKKLEIDNPQLKSDKGLVRC